MRAHSSSFLLPHPRVWKSHEQGRAGAGHPAGRDVRDGGRGWRARNRARPLEPGRHLRRPRGTCQYGGTCGPAAAPSRPARSTSNVRRMESARLSFRHLRRRAVGCSQAPTRVAADGPSAAVPAARYEPYGGRLRMRACQSRSICCWLRVNASSLPKGVRVEEAAAALDGESTGVGFGAQAASVANAQTEKGSLIAAMSLGESLTSRMPFSQAKHLIIQ
jgi:hypothetical protein